MVLSRLWSKPLKNSPLAPTKPISASTTISSVTFISASSRTPTRFFSIACFSTTSKRCCPSFTYLLATLSVYQKFFISLLALHPMVCFEVIPFGRFIRMKYDAIIIGSGQAGNPLAYRLADLGWSVALVEQKHLGGTCINTGCTPTKTMVHRAQVAHYARNAARW